MTISVQPRQVSTITPLSVQTAEPTNTPPALPPASNDNEPARTEPPPAGTTLERPFNFKQALGDQQNLKTLGDALAQIATRLGPDASPTAVLNALQTTPMALHPDSAAFAALGEYATLESFINRLGLRMPHDPFSLGGLSDGVINRSQEHPLGSLDGALGWPVPMSASERRMLHVMARRLPLSEGGYGGRLLDYLRDHTYLSPEALRDPISTLNTLLSSPTAQLAGTSFRDFLKGVPADRSALDYLLAALILQLDPDSVTAPKRNTVAGFDLASENHWGKPASEVVSALKTHLSDPGKVGPEMADVGTHLLLAARAPVFLIKDIPDSVTYGSPAWVNLAVAAATIEAQTPGRVPSMTYAQVMLEAEGAGLANPAVTEDAQRSALIDWGVANGVLDKKDEHQYTADELTALVNTFNTRQSSMRTATEAFTKELPSRKEMALAELKKRFPGMESTFGNKVITILPEGAVNEFGPHSLLDATMMSAYRDSVYSSTDSRTPVAQLNEQPGFGIFAAFQSQFQNTIDEKKTAVGTSIKHLISQLPVQDRKNFEYGKLDFYRTRSTELGTGFFDKKDLPKDPKLLVRTELNGVRTGYEIDFNAGTIRTVPEGIASAYSWRTTNVEHKREMFTPAGSAADLRNEQPLSNTSRLDSFSSARTQLIADAFVEHINLDDPAIKKQALGRTNADKYRSAANDVGQFMLDLIPFVSTVKNFAKGNIGEGIVDLGLDLFGFLTAGAGTAGKLTKIAGSAVSGATKVARATKVIGGAVFRQLNPVDGVIGLIEGGGKLIGKGVSKLAEGVNILRGASGSYDLLKAASTTYDVAAIGTYKVAQQAVEGGAIYREGKWYAYDSVKQQPYGPELVGFTPTTAAAKGEINSNFLNWLSAVVAPNTRTENLSEILSNTLNTAKQDDLLAFNRGYASASVENIPGYYPTMQIWELKELAITAGRTPEEIGALAKVIETRQLRNSLENFRVFNDEVTSAGGTSTAMPQGFYLSQSDLASKGECAALVNTMALAIQEGRQNALIGNFFKASTNNGDPIIAAFRRQLNEMHTIVRDSFHGTAPVTKKAYTEIISDLHDATQTKMLKIATKDHGLLAGVTVNTSQVDGVDVITREWFFFDPNFGVAKFPDHASFERGLQLTLNNGKTAGTLKPVAITRGVPEYDVSTFNDMNFLATVPHHNPYALFNREL